MHNLLRLFGTAANIIVVMLGAAILLRNPQGNTRSISHHIVTKRHYFLIMGAALTIFGALYYAFIIWWFMPQYQLPSWLLPVLAVAFIAQMVVAWVPATSQNAKEHYIGTVHALGGIVVASAMVACLWALAVGGTFMYEWQQTLSLGLAIICSALYLALFFSLYGSRRFLLIVESLFIAIFSAGMFILTWL